MRRCRHISEWLQVAAEPPGPKSFRRKWFCLRPVKNSCKRWKQHNASLSDRNCDFRWGTTAQWLTRSRTWQRGCREPEDSRLGFMQLRQFPVYAGERRGHSHVSRQWTEKPLTKYLRQTGQQKDSSNYSYKKKNILSLFELCNGAFILIWFSNFFLLFL